MKALIEKTKEIESLLSKIDMDNSKLKTIGKLINIIYQTDSTHNVRITQNTLDKLKKHKAKINYNKIWDSDKAKDYDELINELINKYLNFMI